MKKLIIRDTSLLLFGLLVSATPSVAASSPYQGCNLLSSTDGRYEFVYKPSGAHRSQAVVVLPSRFSGVTRSLDFFTNNKKKIETLFQKSNGICIPGLECLKRPTFAAAMPGASYQRRYGSIVLRAKTNSGSCFLWKIRKPALRSD